MTTVPYSLILLVIPCIIWAEPIQKSAVVPKVKFSDGNEIPILGLGTWQSESKDVIQAVKDAIDIGYRHFDCAYVYENEKEVGEALKAKLADGTVKREDLFITSKLSNAFHSPQLVESALRQSLTNLSLDYVDLYLIHSPMGYNENAGISPKDEQGHMLFSDVDYVETWKAMEEVQKKGLAKSIGISNFNKTQIDRILQIATITPVTNQVECHPYLNQQKLLDYCKSKGITITAYSPLGSPNSLFPNKKLPKLMDDPNIKQIAEQYKKTPAQVLIRYQVQRGVIVIPKSVTKSRLEENFNVFDFELTAKDMETLNSLNRNGRYATFSQSYGHKFHPFEHGDGF